MTYLIIFSILVTYPISHLLMKKGMMLDDSMPNDRRWKLLYKFFTIPGVNILYMLVYLLIMLIKFKR